MVLNQNSLYHLNQYPYNTLYLEDFNLIPSSTLMKPNENDMEKSSPTPNIQEIKDIERGQTLNNEDRVVMPPQEQEQHESPPKSLKTLHIIDQKHLDDQKQLECEIPTTPKKTEEEVKDRSSIYVKVLFNYIQILAILSTFPFDWPSELSNLFSDNKEAQKSSQSFFSIDCFLKGDVFSKVGFRVFFTKLMLYSLSPVGFLIICYAVWLLFYYAKWRGRIREHRIEFEEDLITSMVVLLFMVHPNILQQDFDSFAYLLFLFKFFNFNIF